MDNRKIGAGYGDRTRLTGLGSQDITTMLSPHLRRGHDRSTSACAQSRSDEREDLVPLLLHEFARHRLQVQPQHRFGVRRAHVEVPVGKFGGDAVDRVHAARLVTRRQAVERFAKEFAPLVTSGPSGVTGYTTGRPAVREVFAYWPALVKKSAVTPRVEVLA